MEQAVEILAALKKLGEPVCLTLLLVFVFTAPFQLSAEEDRFVEEHKTKSLQDFDNADTNIGMNIH